MLPWVEPEELRACANLALVGALPTWDPAKGCRKTWLGYKVRYGILDELRHEDQMHRAQQPQPKFRVLDVSHAGTEPADQYGRTLAREAVEAVERLPVRHARAIRMRYLEERSQDDIAAALGVGESRVSQLQKRGLELLRMDLAA